MAEVERDPELMGDEGVIGVLGTIVGRYAANGPGGQALTQGASSSVRGFVLQLGDQGVSAHAVDEDVQSLATRVKQRVGLPVSRLGSLLGLQGPLVDENPVRNGGFLGLAAVALGAVPFPPAEVFPQPFLPAQRREVNKAVDRLMANQRLSVIPVQAPGNDLWRPAALQTQDHVASQGPLSKLGLGATSLAPLAVAALGQVRQVAEPSPVAAQLTAQGRLASAQGPGDVCQATTFVDPLTDGQAFLGAQMAVFVHTTLLSQ